jgi:LPXTG-motif cell wall-anchored protein
MTPSPTANSEIPVISATAEPIDDGSTGGSASSWILFAGIGLVVAGAAFFFIRQRG